MSSDLRRQRRLTGRYALVDGIPFTMPVNSEHSPALMAAFPVDADAAATLLPGGEVHPFRLPNGRGLLVVTVIDYRTTDIGSYIEFSIAVACTHGAVPAPAMLPALLRGHFGTGQYVLDLPVSTEISVRGGKGIWGMPKHQANLDFTIGDREVSSQYDVDGQLAMRIEVDMPRTPAIPLALSSSNYCAFRGMLMRSGIAFHAKAHLAAGPFARARLYLGASPQVDMLRGLDISGRPLFTAWMPDTHGILDDHTESWFLTSDVPVQRPPEGLESVIDLTLSEQWLAPPTATHGAPLTPES